MFFSKKEAIDIRDIPRPKVNIGKAFVANDGSGYVDFTKKRKLPSELAKEKALLKTISQPAPSANSAPASSFSFFDTPTPSAQSYSSQSSSTDNSDVEELMRKLSSQISDLDSKLYKMEQRIELLERKAGVGDSSSSSGFAW
jgi:hypothetical protein